MNRRRASSRGSVRRPAPASARWVSASGASPSRAFASARRTCVAAEASSGRPRATETSATARSPSAASSRRSPRASASLRPGAERQRAAVELGQRRDARLRSARGPIRAQRLDEHASGSDVGSYAKVGSGGANIAATEASSAPSPTTCTQCIVLRRSSDR